MTDPGKPWDAALVRTWLDKRLAAARLDQAAADRRGYAAADKYDVAAAEEWVCRALTAGDATQAQAAFARRVKDLIAQDDYPATGINDDTRFQRHVRSHLRRLAKMAKTNAGFDNMLRFRRDG